jgi:hypothetical protein
MRPAHRYQDRGVGIETQPPVAVSGVRTRSGKQYCGAGINARLQYTDMKPTSKYQQGGIHTA